MFIIGKVICTLDSIDSIKSLKRSPQHIFVEDNREKYHIPTGREAKQTLKQLQLTKFPGQLPFTHSIEAFSNIYLVQVLVYYSKDHPLHFGNPNHKDICCLFCMGGIHYNLLTPTKSKLPQTAIDALSSFPILSASVVILHLLISEDSEDENDDILIENVPTSSIVTIDGEENIQVAIINHHEFAHIGQNKLYALLEWIIWHPKLRIICKDISMTCHHCQLGKVSNIYHAPPTIKINTRFPFELVAVDLLQLPKSSKGNSYIFVLIDHYITHLPQSVITPISVDESFSFHLNELFASPINFSPTPDSFSLINTSNSSTIPTHFSPVNLNTQVMLSPVSPQQSSIISYTPLTITNQLITSELHPVRRCFRRLSSENIIFNLEDSQTSVSNNVNDRLVNSPITPSLDDSFLKNHPMQTTTSSPINFIIPQLNLVLLIGHSWISYLENNYNLQCIIQRTHETPLFELDGQETYCALSEVLVL
ncbi:hypothetical protein Avbf_18182 [Armadillidium vulgare]|nr:hypothetical protein Avbf_18182 [Armadillidium vulgare]